jgi:Kef-type K+ transport system membrane component KefB
MTLSSPATYAKSVKISSSFFSCRYFLRSPECARTSAFCRSPADWLICLLIILVASFGKFGGTFFAARLTGSDGREAASLGILMNTRGLMELVVLNVGLEDLNNFWMAHKPKTMSELYSHLHEELETRLVEAERVGYGFAIPKTVAVVPSILDFLARFR